MLVSEAEFSATVRNTLSGKMRPDFVTGPGRSGAVAAVYASYALSAPYIPHSTRPAEPGETMLVIDTVSMSGRTIRKAASRWKRLGYEVEALVLYSSPTIRHHFWYENLAIDVPEHLS
jgi:adenine/guanine phosphoribosyltransferase-like PRPP-binding protein